MPSRPGQEQGADVRRTRLIVGAGAAAATAAALLLGGIFRDSSGAQPTARATAIACRSCDGSSCRRASRRGANGTVADGRQAAGDATGRSRTTCSRSARSASPTSSGRARPAIRPTTRSRSRCCDRALRLAPRDLVATSGLGSLALSRHRFAEALVLGRKAHAISPTTALTYGITGDALVELGRYRRSLRGVRHDGDAAARASPRTRASRTGSSCSGACPRRSRR